MDPIDPAPLPPAAEIPPPARWRATLIRLGSFLWIALAAWAIYGWHKEWSHFHLTDLDEALALIGPSHLVLAITFTLLSYSCNAALALVACRWIQQPIKRPLLDFLTSFISSAFAINAGGTILGAGSIRMRFAAAQKITPTQVGRITAFSGLAGWNGHAILAAILLLLAPPPIDWLTPAITTPLAVVLILLSILAIFAQPLFSKRWPSPSITFIATIISIADWAASGLAMWALLPSGTPIDPWAIVSVVVIAQAIAALTHVPGGIGILEYTITKSLAASIAAPTLAGTLITYRITYYLLPFFIALALLSLREITLRRASLHKGGKLALKGWSAIGPRLASILALAGGWMLLASANTPIEASRRHGIEHLLPLPFVEGSHFLSSLAGALLIVLALGLLRRIHAAWILTVTTMIGGIIFSLTKGLDWEEASILALMLACLLPFRNHFYRASTLWSYRFTPAWWLMIIALLGSSIWIGFFTSRHIPYQSDLWWKFAMEGDASRFLRGSSGALCLIIVAALAQALRPARPRSTTTTHLDEIIPLIESSDHSDANLAYLGDKQFLLSADQSSALMFADQGRSRIVMGDPIGRSDTADDLLWRFIEKARDEGMKPVFYSISVTQMPRLVDMGFKLFKLGEEAIIPLDTFSIDSPNSRKFRKSLQRFRQTACTFSIWSPHEVSQRLGELRQISDEWLAQHQSGEKRFSLGFFSEDYMKRFPCAVVSDPNGKAIAFANLWQTHCRNELSVDLMRHLPDAPKGIMEIIFIELLKWGKDQGFQSFNLGMAPLSGLSSHPLAPAWHKIASRIFHRGESFYNFQGLRSYKEKFHPDWQPRYLAVQGSWNLPSALLDATTLIGGGWKSTFSKPRP